MKGPFWGLHKSIRGGTKEAEAVLERKVVSRA